LLVIAAIGLSLELLCLAFALPCLAMRNPPNRDWVYLVFSFLVAVSTLRIVRETRLLTATWIGEKEERVDEVLLYAERLVTLKDGNTNRVGSGTVATVKILDAKDNDHTLSNSTSSASAATAQAVEAAVEAAVEVEVAVVQNNNGTTTKQLPSFENGGVIVFYHIYKTGGSTVRGVVGKKEMGTRRKKKLHYKRMGRAVGNFKVEDTVTNAVKTGEVCFVELHINHPAPFYPTLVDLGPQLKLWKDLTQQHNLGFFSFTVLREPVSFALSFFNSMHVNYNPEKKWQPLYSLEATQRDFLQSLVPNRQCVLFGTSPVGLGTFLATREEIPEETLEHYPRRTPCQVDSVERALLSLDWVGTTEQLTTHTLPLLTHLLEGNASKGYRQQSMNVYANKTGVRAALAFEGLSPETIHLVRRDTRLDRRLYHKISQHFTLEAFGLNFSSMG
jgi:hypothetical protein